MAKASSRSPHGERGLKLGIAVRLVPGQWSLPAWGAWIEIARPGMALIFAWSLPAWGAWIEINMWHLSHGDEWVAPRMGSVD